MMRRDDVNMAMIQQAAEELEIAVPIRAWEVVDGELVLHLAYGNVARWTPGNGAARTTGQPGRPWRFEEAIRKPGAALPPAGSLKKLRKQQLRNLALDWGFQSDSAYVNKAELVEAVTWLRDEVGSAGDTS